jgi:hypothetical protein
MRQHVHCDLEADRWMANTLAELIIGGSLASSGKIRLSPPVRACLLVTVTGGAANPADRAQWSARRKQMSVLDADDVQAGARHHQDAIASGRRENFGTLS